MSDETTRCNRCGWPLAKSKKEGCMPNDCSQRPLPPLREPAPAAVSDPPAIGPRTGELPAVDDAGVPGPDSLADFQDANEETRARIPDMANAKTPGPALSEAEVAEMRHLLSSGFSWWGVSAQAKVRALAFRLLAEREAMRAELAAMTDRLEVAESDRDSSDAALDTVRAVLKQATEELAAVREASYASDVALRAANRRLRADLETMTAERDALKKALDEKVRTAWAERDEAKREKAEALSALVNADRNLARVTAERDALAKVAMSEPKRMTPERLARIEAGVDIVHMSHDTQMAMIDARKERP